MPDDVLSHLLGVPMEKEAARMNRKTVMVPQHSDHCPHCDFEFREKSYPRMKHEGKDVEDHAAAYESGEYDEHCPQCDGVIDQKEKSDEEIADSQGWDYPGRVEQETARRDAQRRRRLAREAKANEKSAGFSAHLIAMGGMEGYGANRAPDVVWTKEAKVVVPASKGDFSVATHVLDHARGKVEPDPTEARINAGNFSKGHIRWNGLEVAIETPLNGWRKGKNPDGKPWESQMKGGDYGYIKGTVAADSDCLDFLLGPHPESEIVFIVDQLDQNFTKANKGEDSLLWPGRIIRGKDGYEKRAARDVSLPGVPNVEGYEGEVQQSKKFPLSQLWGARDQGLCALAEFQKLHRGHGKEAGDLYVHRAGGQRQGLLSGELPMGDRVGTNEECQKESKVSFSGGVADYPGNIGAHGEELLHVKGEVTDTRSEPRGGIIQTLLGHGEAIQDLADVQGADAVVGGLGKRAEYQPSYSPGSYQEDGAGCGSNPPSGPAPIKVASKNKGYEWWDESKVLAGFLNQAEAKAAYLSCYPPGWKCGPITALPVADFIHYVNNGDLKSPCSAHHNLKTYQSSKGKQAGLLDLLGLDKEAANSAAISKAMTEAGIPRDVQFYVNGDRATAFFGDWHEKEIWEATNKLGRKLFKNYEEPDDSEIGEPEWSKTSIRSKTEGKDVIHECKHNHCPKCGNVTNFCKDSTDGEHEPKKITNNVCKGCAVAAAEAAPSAIAGVPVKLANTPLKQLLKAKEHSDAKRYTAKKAILAKLIGEAPDDFTVDSPGGKYPGLTHKPTGFKIHAPKSVAALIKEKQAIVKQDESSGEWILWTKDMKRKLGTHPTAQDAYKQEYAIQKSQERETEKEARSPSKGCLMVTLPPDAAKKTLAYAKTNIPDDQLAEDGIETDPHATVLYGFDNSVALGDLDLPTAPIDLKLGKVKRFKADDNRPGSDVLVIAVNSSAMTDLNAKLKKEHNVTSTYDSYAPHVTLAYVKPGALPELDGSDNFAGETFTADELVLSRTVDGERDKTTMQLTGKSASVLNILGLEKEAARPNFARNVGVGIAGAIPGRLLGELLAEQLAKRKIISGTNSLPGSVIRAGSAGLGAGVAQALDGQFQDHKWDEKGRKIKKPKQPKQEEAEEQAKAASLERARCQGYLDAHFKQASDSGFAPTSPQPVNYSPPAPAPVGQTSSGGGWGGIMSALGGGGAQQPAAPSPGSFTYGQPARPTAPPPEQGMWQSVGGAQGIGNSVKGFGEGVGNLAGSIAAAYNPYAAAAVGIGHGSNLIGDVVANKDRYWNKFMTGSDGGVARKDLVNRVEGFSAKDVKLPFEDTGWGKKFWGVSNSIMPLQNSILRGAVSTFGNAAIAGMNAFGDRADPNARAPLRAGPAKAAARSDGFLTMTLKNQGIDTDFNYRPPTSEILKRQVPILGGAASWSLPNMPFVAGASGLKLLGKAVGHAGPDINPATGYLDWFTKVVGHPATSRWKDALYRMTSGSNGKEPGLLGIGPMTTQIISQLNPWSK